MNTDETNPVLKVPVSERALIARINRRLDVSRRFHRTHEGSCASAALGRYYIAAGDVVTDYRDLKVLAPYERVEG